MSKNIHVKINGWFTLISQNAPDIKGILKVILDHLNVEKEYYNKYTLLSLFSCLLVNLVRHPNKGKNIQPTKRGPVEMDEYRWELKTSTYLPIKKVLEVDRLITSNETIQVKTGSVLKWGFQVTVSSKEQGKQYFVIDKDEEELVRKLFQEFYPQVLKGGTLKKNPPPTCPERHKESLRQEATGDIAEETRENSSTSGVSFNWGGKRTNL